MACGGWESPNKRSCVSFTPGGTWTASHTLIKDRVRPLTWQTAEGVFLMSDFTSELITADGNSEEKFFGRFSGYVGRVSIAVKNIDLCETSYKDCLYLQ